MTLAKWVASQARLDSGFDNKSAPVLLRNKFVDLYLLSNPPSH